MKACAKLFCMGIHNKIACMACTLLAAMSRISAQAHARAHDTHVGIQVSACPSAWKHKCPTRTRMQVHLLQMRSGLYWLAIQARGRLCRSRICRRMAASTRRTRQHCLPLHRFTLPRRVRRRRRAPPLLAPAAWPAAQPSTAGHALSWAAGASVPAPQLQAPVHLRLAGHRGWVRAEGRSGSAARLRHDRATSHMQTSAAAP